MLTKEEHRSAYERKLRVWEMRGEPVPDVRPVATADLIALKREMRLVNMGQSLPTLITYDVMNYLHQHRILSTAELLELCKTTRQSLYKRLRVLRNFNFIRKVGRCYYMATPRLDEYMRTRVAVYFNLTEVERTRLERDGESA